MSIEPIPITLGDQAALLAWDTLSPSLDDLRDKLYDVWVLEGSAALDPADLRQVAASLLAVHHAALRTEAPTEAEAVEADMLVGLLWGLDLDALRALVLLALFGTELQAAGSPRYSAWARSALRANGIDPRSLTAVERADVLRHLVHAGRCVPPGDWIDAVAATLQALP